MALAIGYPTLGYVINGLTSCNDGFLVKRQQREAKVNGGGLWRGLNGLCNATQRRRGKPCKYAIRRTLAGNALAPNKHRQVQVCRNIVIQQDHVVLIMQP
ncbi:hypothetical protein D3C84_1053940 [compost metagenome]